jgi:hypothetical protein
MNKRGWTAPDLTEIRLSISPVMARTPLGIAESFVFNWRHQANRDLQALEHRLFVAGSVPTSRYDTSGKAKLGGVSHPPGEGLNSLFIT